MFLNALYLKIESIKLWKFLVEIPLEPDAPVDLTPDVYFL